MARILAQNDLSRWLAALGASAVYAPQCRDGVWSYELTAAEADITLDHPMTVAPVKAIVFRQRELLLEFRDGGETGLQLTEILPEDAPVVVVGVRPCEAKALLLLDKVLGAEPADDWYARRRRATALIGLACAPPPSADCFCTSVNGRPYAEDGLDVILTDMGDRYHVKALTDRGAALVASGASLTSEATPDDESTVQEIHAAAEAAVPRRVSAVDELPSRLADAFDAPLWHEESRACIHCGICTYMCPTCHCFDICDEVESEVPLAGVRVRNWDTCQFPDFTMHSSGHNPRPDSASRLRQRISHKFRYFVETWGECMCTGCGRCTSLCPVGIDLISVLEKVQGHGG